MYCTVGTAGHVDHGKTSLVRALTGVDTDRLKEEKERGLSIELGFAHFEAVLADGAGPLHISIVDVPGHERFIRTMLAGTTGIDLVLFVVAADDGVMPQTSEHLDIVRLLNVERAVFVISKVDRVAPKRVAEVREEVEGLLKGTALEGSPFLLASAETREGIDEVRAEIVNACSLIKVRADGDGRGPLFRLPVDRSFLVKGFGTVVTGTVASGIVRKNDTVSAFTAGRKPLKLRVRGIESSHREVESAGAGARAALNLSSLPQGALNRGTTLARSSFVDYVSESLKASGAKPVPLKMDCSFEFLPSFDKKAVLKGKKRLKLFHLTGDSLVTVRLSKESKGTGLDFCGRFTLLTPLLCLRGDHFILRDTATNTTVGGGRVLLPYYNPLLAIGINSIDYQALTGADIPKVLTTLLGPREVGFSLKGLQYMLNLNTNDIIKDAKGFFDTGEFLLSLERSRALNEKLVETLKSFHADSPSRKGLAEGALISKLKEGSGFSWRLAGPGILKVAVEQLIADSLVRRDGALIRLAEHAPSLSEADVRTRKAVMALFKPGFNAVKTDELYKLPFKRSEVERVVSYLLNERLLVRLKEGKFLAAVAIGEAKESLLRVLEALGKGDGNGETSVKGITVSEFRDALGTGRKMAMEILEYFDNEHVTVRHGDYRVLRDSGKARGDNIV